MKLTVYEAPAAEVVAVKMERTVLSAQLSSSRASYGPANDGVGSGETMDDDGNWIWN